MNKLKSLYSRAANVALVLFAAALVCLDHIFNAVVPVPFVRALGLTEDEREAKLLDTLGEISKKLGKVDTVEKAAADNKAANEEIRKALEEVKAQILTFQKSQLAVRTLRMKRGGEVSDECARFLGAVYLQGAIIQEKLTGEARITQARSVIEGIVGKTALSSSDIPLPTEYSSEVVELVSEYGAARKFGTVFPLGAGSVKLPRLKTDPIFGLVAVSSGGAEKSPQTEFVTFAPEKFGGIIRVPSEIDEDSIVPMGQFLARYAARQMAYIEDYQFFLSTGADSGANGAVKGLCLSTIDNSKVVQMASGKTKYSDVTLANLRSVRAAVDAAALGRSAYYMHPSFEQALSGLNSSGDKPYIANGINGASLDGFPIRWVDAMPAYSTSANVSKVFALFGDASFQYLGVRGGMRFDVSREAGFTTDEILVRALERFTIGLMATGAVAGLETAAS